MAQRAGRALRDQWASDRFYRDHPEIMALQQAFDGAVEAAKASLNVPVETAVTWTALSASRIYDPGRGVYEIIVERMVIDKSTMTLTKTEVGRYGSIEAFQSFVTAISAGKN